MQLTRNSSAGRNLRGLEEISGRDYLSSDDEDTRRGHESPCEITRFTTRGASRIFHTLYACETGRVYPPCAARV